MRWGIAHAATTGCEIAMVYVLSSVWEWEFAAAQVNPDPIRDEFGQLLDGEWSQPLRDAGVRYCSVLEVGRPADDLDDAIDPGLGQEGSHAADVRIDGPHQMEVSQTISSSERDVAAVDEDRAASHEHREIAGAERRDPSDVVGNSRATER